MLIRQRTVPYFVPPSITVTCGGLHPHFYSKLHRWLVPHYGSDMERAQNSDSEGTERAQNSASYTAYKDLCGGWGLVCVCIA